jgi:hypothetical protein
MVISALTRRIMLVGLVLFVVCGGVALGARDATAEPRGPAWEDCGKYTCTIYYSRSKTKQVKTYLDGPAGATAAASADIGCGLLGLAAATRLPFIGVPAGYFCAHNAGRYDWRPQVREAAAHNACFQVAYPRGFPGKAWPTPGWTNHPGYCVN